MSKKQFRAAASSGRVAGGFGGFGAVGSTQSSVLAYIQEPPDYASITDANVVVAFKNLSKKDGITKAKALEDLQAYIEGLDGEIEDGILEAWINLFPRLTIDNTRRVRQLAFVVHAQICSKCGKRIAKHMPRIAGPWLAGAYDNDRVAAKAAQDSLTQVFPSLDKVLGVRRTFHKATLDYCKDAILVETVNTLSDGRHVSKDDAEATYFRVLSSCLAVVCSLVDDLEKQELEKQLDTYQELFHNGILDFATSPDPTVRRATHKLVRSASSKLQALISQDLKGLSTAYIYKGLHSDQMRSSLEYLASVTTLTSLFPTLWTDAYSGKKPASSRLCWFLKHATSGGSAEFWLMLRRLIDVLPNEILPKTSDEAAELLRATRDGVSRKEERFVAAEAWQTYMSLFKTAIEPLPESEQKQTVQAWLLPLITQYLHPSTDNTEWGVTAAKPASIVSKAAQVPRFLIVFQDSLPSLIDRLIEQVGSSQPEQAKEYDTSQKQVAAAGERFSALQHALLEESTGMTEEVRATMLEEDVRLISQALEVITRRDGKPYGAAAVVDDLLRTLGAYLTKIDQLIPRLTSFVANHLPRLLYTPSRRYLSRCVKLLKDDPSFAELFPKTFEATIETDAPSASKIEAVRALLDDDPSEDMLTLANNSHQLQDLFRSLCAPAEPQGLIKQPKLLADMLTLGVMSPTTVSQCLHILADLLSDEASAAEALAVLDVLVLSHKDVLTNFAAETASSGDLLLPRILRLEEAHDEKLASLATALASNLSMSEGALTERERFTVVRQALENVGSASLSIEAVHDLTARLLAPSLAISDIGDLMPDLESWTDSLMSALLAPQPELAISSPFGGALNFVKSSSDPMRTTDYDVEGLSKPLRIAMFLVKTFSPTDPTKTLLSSLSLENESHTQALFLIMVTAIAAQDKVNLVNSNSLWIPTVDLEVDVLAFISEAMGTVADLIGHSDADQINSSLAKAKSTTGATNSVSAYYWSAAKAKLFTLAVDTHGSNVSLISDIAEFIRSKRHGEDFFEYLAYLVGFRQSLVGSQVLNRMCNELVADLTVVDIQVDRQKAQRSLIILNAILEDEESLPPVVAKQRLIFLIKHVIPWVEDKQDIRVAQEIEKLLIRLLPEVTDLYGEHWTRVIQFILDTWASTAKQAFAGDGLVLFYWSLKLYAMLQKLCLSDDVNDDLPDAMKEHKLQLSKSLLQLLKSADGVADHSNQPLAITFELLSRQMLGHPDMEVKHANDLFALMYTPSRSIQEAAFALLSRVIPKAQEQISLDAALENKTAYLPDELLSLILEAPSLDSLAQASFNRYMPLSLQSYLYSWRLLFSHFQGSSYKVKNDYTDQIKDGQYLPGLLNLTLDFLGHTRGKPVDVSRYDVVNYYADTEPIPEKDVQWLLTHLYYLTLTYLPSAAKSYILELRSRQLPALVESWTAKYISPLIIDSSLLAVSDWSKNTVQEDPDYDKMNVKVGMRSREINVSYVIDEQTMAIKVVLPDAYPLASAQVAGVSRVAVREEKWQSWLRNCQGVITFSNGSITDGLSAWRRNVTGALKGQTECAICYSIISADKQLPTKRCPTCKNLFHSSCLFKWFKTSNASTCPLCRNPFNFN